eukprot:9552706-Prorocentrum_lima.AAC.1
MGRRGGSSVDLDVVHGLPNVGLLGLLLGRHNDQQAMLPACIVAIFLATASAQPVDVLLGV